MINKMSELQGYVLLKILKMLDMKYEELLQLIPDITTEFENLSYEEAVVLVRHSFLLSQRIRRKKVSDTDYTEIKERLTHILSNKLERS